MKFTVTQEVFKKALEIGALAATSDTAQLDDESIELLIRSVKISVDETLLVQSGHNLLATKYSLEAEKKTGISVTEKGSILVPAKELLKWVNAQGKNSTINVELEESPSPTTIDIQSEQDGEEVAKFSIKKIGTVKLISQDTSKTVGKWELDCYDPEQAIQISFDDNDKGEHLFDIQAQKLTHALSKVSCATLDSDYNHIKDSVSIQNHNGEIFFATTDTKRCALYKGTNIDNIDSEKNALVPMRLLTLASKVLEVEGRTSLYYNEDGCKVYLSQKNVDVRITCPDKDTVAKFEDISKLLDKKYVDAGEIEKSQFMKMLTSSALVNKRAVCLFLIKIRNLLL